MESVESSYKATRSINADGCYTIGSQSLDVHMRLKEVVRLESNSDKQLTKYTLDDLKDLECKLVLITSHDSEESGEVDLFMQVSCLFTFVC